MVEGEQPHALDYSFSFQGQYRKANNISLGRFLGGFDNLNLVFTEMSEGISYLYTKPIALFMGNNTSLPH
jgi:hypothetical protein